MIVDGKKLATDLEQKLVKEVQKLKKAKISIMAVTGVAKEDPEGNFYSQLKMEAAAKIGIKFKKVTFSFKEEKELGKLPQLIKKYSYDKKIQGVMIQKPSKAIILKYFTDLEHFKEFWLKVTNQIDEKKDIDCLTTKNLGRLLIGKPLFLPATVAAIMKIIFSILENEQKLEGKNIIILGSSEILGKPLALILRDKGATVTLCGSKTKNLKEICLQSEIIISGVGYPKLITQDMVRAKTIIIDAGTKKIGQKILGDVDFERVKNKVAYITPVPGGVGPLTVISLLENLILATKRQTQ